MMRNHDRLEELNFSEEEFNARLQNVRGLMVKFNIDVLIVTDPCNIFYLTGYEAWSFYVQQYLLVTMDNNPIWIGREQDARGVALTTWLPLPNILSYADNYVQSADRHPAQWLCALLSERGFAKARIGAEASNYYLTATAWLTLVAGLPNANLIDVSLLINQVRLVKSPAEISHMRAAAAIVQGAMQVALTRARPGVRGCDVAGEVYRALIAGTPEAGGQYASTPPLMPSGDRVATSHLSWTDARYTEDGQTNFELVASRFRYHVPLARTLYLGSPPKNLVDLGKVAVEALEAALDVIRPGILACDIETAWQSVARRYGINKSSRCGYSIGLAYPPTFGEQTVSLRPEDKTVLAEGMTFHLMPGVWQDGASIVITEPFVVTSTGCETFCNFPRQLFLDG